MAVWPSPPLLQVHLLRVDTRYWSSSDLLGCSNGRRARLLALSPSRRTRPRPARTPCRQREVDEAVTVAMRALDRFSDRAAAADVVEDLDAALTRFRRYFTASAEQAAGIPGTVNAEPESFRRA